LWGNGGNPSDGGKRGRSEKAKKEKTHRERVRVLPREKKKVPESPARRLFQKGEGEKMDTKNNCGTLTLPQENGIGTEKELRKTTNAEEEQREEKNFPKKAIITFREGGEGTNKKKKKNKQFFGLVSFAEKLCLGKTVTGAYGQSPQRTERFGTFPVLLKKTRKNGKWSRVMRKQGTLEVNRVRR